MLNPESRDPNPKSQIPKDSQATLGFGIWELGFGIYLARIACERRRRHVRRGNLEREAERRNTVARMIVRVGELRQPIELLAAFRPLVDAWIEIDEMHAGRARGGEMNDNVTAGIEAARISHVCVVVRRHVDVVVF